MFYNEINEFDNIHNGYAKNNKHNQVIQIDEHENCNDVQMSMDTLNLDIAK